MISTVLKFAATSALALGMLGGATSLSNAQPIDRSGSGQCAGQGGCIGDDLIEGPRGSSGGSREFLRDRDRARDDRREVRRDRDRDRDRREYRRDRERSDYRDRRYRDRDGYSYYRDPYRYRQPSVVFEYSRPAYRTVVPVRPSYVRPGAYSSAHIDWCYARYRSYRASDNTFQPYGGPRRSCYSPYS